MSAPTTFEHPQTREAFFEWLNDDAPHFLNHGKSLDELKVMTDKELTQLYYSILGIFYIA